MVLYGSETNSLVILGTNRRGQFWARVTSGGKRGEQQYNRFFMSDKQSCQ